MKLVRLLQARPTQDGDGVNISRIPGFDGKYLDPYLMIDELKSDDSKDFIGGFPPHPHRGIETFTYIRKGGFEHQDQMGNKKAIRAGDVQWMSTGRGVIHSEMPLADAADGMHGFQIWINMPSGDKMRPPRYQDSTYAPLPKAQNQRGAELTALAGSWDLEGDRINSPLQELAANAALADVTLVPGGSLTLAALKQKNVMLYVHSGELDGGYRAGHLLLLDPDSDIAVSSSAGAGFLILAGDPLNQPIAHMGPFVMTTQEELMQAVRDYQQGRFGSID